VSRLRHGTQSFESIECTLQDKDGSMLIDDGFAFAAARIGGDQFALHCRRVAR